MRSHPIKRKLLKLDAVPRGDSSYVNKTATRKKRIIDPMKSLKSISIQVFKYRVYKFVTHLLTYFIINNVKSREPTYCTGIKMEWSALTLNKY